MAGNRNNVILKDSLLIRISSTIQGVTPSELSVYLDFSATQGDHALIVGLANLNPQSAYQSLLHRFVDKHGTDGPGALKLRQIFRENNMALCAEIIEKELRKFNIDFAEHIETPKSPTPSLAGNLNDTILNDSLLIRISSTIQGVTPSELSVYLDFSATQGDHALIVGLANLNPQSAYQSLLHRFVDKHGTDGPGALKLRQIFRENEMTLCAEIIEKELRRLNIDFDEYTKTPKPPTPALAGNLNDTILNDSLLIRISSTIQCVTPSELSVYLDFSATQGDHALIVGLANLNPQSAYQSLLHRFVDKHGTDGPGALKLRKIFRENDMTLCAEIIEKELKKLNIDFAVHIETPKSPTPALSGNLNDTILNDSLLIRISSTIQGVTPSELSVYLDFSATQGDHALIVGLVNLNPQSAYQSLLHRFVDKHGTELPGALKLRQIFRENNMTLCAEIIEREMRRLNIDFPDHSRDEDH